MSNKKNAAIYARVSSERQDGEDKVSIQQQLEACRALCQYLSAAARNRNYYKYKNGRLVKKYELHGDIGYRYYCGTASMCSEEPHTKPYTSKGEELDDA